MRKEWIKTGQIRKNVHLDEWVVMPNHFHGIIMLRGGLVKSRGDVAQNVSTKTDLIWVMGHETKREKP